MKLVELQRLASKGYSDGDGLGDYFDPQTGQPTAWHSGDSLEWFVAIEIAETFDPEANDATQIAEAIRALEQGRTNLEAAKTSLEHFEPL